MVVEALEVVIIKVIDDEDERSLPDDEVVAD